MKNVKKTRLFAEQIRRESLRAMSVIKTGHVGGCMSLADTLAVLYEDVMDVRPEEPRWADRDRLVISKGHAGPALYAALSLKGFFPGEMLTTLNQGGTHLPSHCDRNHTPGVDMTTGSLGQGISSAIGIAMANRIDGRKNYTYMILGDGECDEGQVWEGAMLAGTKKLSNLIGFVDFNNQQLDGYLNEIIDLANIGERFSAFGWYTQEIDGHDLEGIYNAIQNAKTKNEGKPSMIILHTQKGRGCNFAENIRNNHSMTFTQETYDAAVAEIDARIAAYAAELN